MLPIANRPLIQYLLNWFKSAGLYRVAICMAPTGDIGALSRIVELDDQCEIHLFFDATPRGPAGCCSDVARVLRAPHYIVSEICMPPALDLAGFLNSHAASGAAASLLVEEMSDATPAGDCSGRPACLMALTREALELVPATGYQDLKEVLLARLSREGRKVRAVPVSVGSRPLDGLDAYLNAQEAALSAEARDWLPGEFARRGDMLIHRTARVSETVRNQGQVLIGPDCRVMDGCILVGPAVLGPRAQVGDASVVARSVLWEDSRIGPSSVVWSCVVADGARIGPNARHRGELLSGEVD